MFIPDSGFVGTAFVNALSNQLVSICCQATIELTALNGIRLKIFSLWPDLFIRIRDDDLSHLSLIKSISKDQDQVRIHVGTLQSGQSRNFLLECHRPENMSNEDFLQSFRFKLEYTPYGTDTRRDQQEIYCTEITETSTQLLEIDVQSFRNRLIYFLHTNSRLSNNAASPSDSILANEMREWLNDHPKSRRGNGANDILHDRVEGMLLDITGQITEVFLNSQ